MTLYELNIINLFFSFSVLICLGVNLKNLDYFFRRNLILFSRFAFSCLLLNVILVFLLTLFFVYR